jgi:hypothetical protein
MRDVPVLETTILAVAPRWYTMTPRDTRRSVATRTHVPLARCIF